MTELATANQSFQDVDGKPIVNGFIYIGKSNADPTIIINQIPIFSDRNMTIPIDNPQRTNSFGRSVNKIWGSGRYAIEVQDEDMAIKFVDQDTGESEGAGIVLLQNVQGINTITAEGISPILQYFDKGIYIFTAAGINTGDVTLDIDGKGAKQVLIETVLELSPGNIIEDQVVIVAYNESLDIFEMVGNVANDGLGKITIWSGALADIPIGHALCDGSNGTPDMVNLFVRGADGIIFMPGVTGGSETTGGHALTEGQLAPHTHPLAFGALGNRTDGDNEKQLTNAAGNTGSAGSGEQHTHPDTVPPFIYLIFIMKI